MLDKQNKKISKVGPEADGIALDSCLEAKAFVNEMRCIIDQCDALVAKKDEEVTLESFKPLAEVIVSQMMTPDKGAASLMSLPSTWQDSLGTG